MNSKRNLLKWWLIIVLTLSGIVIANYFDGIKFVWENDFTKLSFVIMALFILGSSMIGYKLFTNSKSEYSNYETEWLVSEHLLSLGLLGTVIGIFSAFYLSFKGLDIGNAEKAQEVIASMAVSLSVAMLSTICGLVFSMLLKTQLVIAEGDDQ
jgi:hypothetical protein